MTVPLSSVFRMIDVEDQICKMRNELLRSEHEKELALIKLEEEKAEKEKAQRQVQVNIAEENTKCMKQH